MEVKPGYKQTEAGLLPEEWSDPQLAEIVLCSPIRVDT
jgi:hypothetical protein